MEEELVIDENNFGEHFFDVRIHKPQRGQVMACYSAIGEFVDSIEKGHVVDLLKKDKVEPAIQVMTRLHGATYKSALEILKKMTQDMLAGKTDQEIRETPYRIHVEWRYYTKKELIPQDDPHWECVSVRELDEFINAEDGLVIKTKFHIGEENLED